MVKRTTPIVSDRSLTSSVALPASTGSGVTTEVDVRDALRLGDHQNDDTAGDLAADLVTRPVVAVGAIVEPVNPALASEPSITGDLAGDAAIEIAGAGPEFIQPAAVSMETLRPDIYDVAPEANETLNTPPSTTAVEVGAGDTASLAAEQDPDLVVFDLGDELTDADLANLRLVAKHFGIVLLEPGEAARNVRPLEVPRTMESFSTLEAATGTVFGEDISGTPRVNQALRAFYDQAESGQSPYIRISSAIDGFRRGGIAHSKEAVRYRLDEFTPDQVEAILAEPNLVAEII